MATAKDLEDVPAYDGNATTGATTSLVKPQHRRLHDTNVTFEEYNYYARKTRAEENASSATHTSEKTSVMALLLRRKAAPPTHDDSDTSTPPGEKNLASAGNKNLADPSTRLEITDDEWSNASRMMRTANWAACFYLITTDILGVSGRKISSPFYLVPSISSLLFPPFPILVRSIALTVEKPYGVGFALGTLGWGPGIALYTVFGFMAGYSGYLLWTAFLGLDSHEFPVRNYGDLAFRIFGSPARHVVNILQALLLLLILGQVIIQNGQGISQVSKFRLCYAVCCVVFVVVGFGVGQVRTLRNYGWLANMAVFINLMVIFITMGVMAHSAPNYAISRLGSAGGAVDPTTITPDPDTGVYPPIRHYNGLPNPDSLIGSINGLLQGVFAYGGAQLFIEFMAEMRRPHDFIKAMWGAQFFIYSVYLIYGCYVYHFQGQYAYQISYQGVSVYAWQTVGNMLAVLSGLIAAGLYGNIGIKVLYNNVFMDFLRAPPLTTKAGKVLWVIIVPIYWSIAFIIAAAIPDYFGFVSIVSAVAVIQFSYSFPPILAVGYNIHLHAIGASQGDGFDPVTGAVVRRDSGVKRWIRGFFSGPWYLNIAHVLYAGGALATAGLGMYAAVEGMIEAFEIPQVNSFSCRSPLDLSSS